MNRLPQPTRVIVVRHGETVWNTEGRPQGHMDSPLTESGLAQARAVARRIAEQRVDAVYTSDLGRARRVAECIAEACGLECIPEYRLRERAYGVLESHTREVIEERFAEVARLNRESGPDYVIPGGESMRQCWDRSLRFFDELAGRHSGRVVVTVTHAGVLFGLLRCALGIPFEAPLRVKSYNTSYNVFVYREEGWMLETWGDIAHLQELKTMAEE